MWYNVLMNKEIFLHLRMDKKLFEQLQRQADKDDDGVLSVTARKALKKFLIEQNYEQGDDRTTQ
jgi:hypothetical protein